METKRTARVFEDVGGYHICNDADNHLTTSAYPQATKAAALRTAYGVGYTHAVGSGCPWAGVRAIPARYREDDQRHAAAAVRWEVWGPHGLIARDLSRVEAARLAGAIGARVRAAR